jgi:hypothetical protein
MNPVGSRGKVVRSLVLLLVLAGLIAVAEGQHDKKGSSSPPPKPVPHVSAPAQHAPVNRTAPTNRPPTNTRPSTGMGNRPNTTMGNRPNTNMGNRTTPPSAEGRIPEPQGDLGRRL